MRRIAAMAALGTLVCLLVGATPLLAKPTRISARTTRWTAPPPSLRSAHTRTPPHATAARSTPHPDPHAAVSRLARTPDASHAKAAAPSPIRSKRDRVLAAQATLAAHSAILAADRKPSHFRNRAAGIPKSALLVNDGGRLHPLPVGQRPQPLEADATIPLLLPPLRVALLYDSLGRLILPPPLYGSREVLLHQNEMADQDGLTRVQDNADLLDLRREKKLVPLPESSALTVDYRLPEDRRFARPWTATFLIILARDYYAIFRTPIQVDSAVRTVAVQKRLVRTNGNAAPVTGDTASPHLTGQAVDLAKGGLTRIQIAWLRTYLQPLIDQGKIDVEEEFQQACFHISVYKNFLPIAAPRVAVAAARQLPADPTPGGSDQ